MAVRRIWHGWTTRENAGAYESVLRDEVLPSIEAKQIPGYRGIEVLRCDRDGEVEFMTVMSFDSLRNVIEFQGEHYERAYVPEAAQEVLRRWDQLAEHYEVTELRKYE